MKTFKNAKPVPMLLFLALFSLSSMAQVTKPGTIDDDAKMIVKKVDGLQEYSSTLDLNDTRKQLLMAGQNYQTNYGIYASITTGESPLGKNYRTLENVEFEIVNYKPTYFIGIDSIIVAAGKMKNELTFKIFTRALSDTNSFTLNKAALQNIHFEKGSYLHAERYLNPMFPNKDASGRVLFDKDGRVACEPDNGKAFDFEFFYKDGRHVVRKANYDKEAKPQTYLNEIASTLPGKRCWHSFNKVMF